ncbi:hypothetical protein [Microbacterium esteraromaticum]|uniref:hypothetical protein n=1 Tax=Microbacterium esteraromaticum TaxID=57043 RepID=UPI00195CD2E4|nr:hypothetical protein [Microbacterium esteraromaticum]MBM7466146.1 hypothetical protein [Microbacterium esteraromaticum]
MNIYGPSAATGLGAASAGGAAIFGADNPIFVGLAVFTLIGAALAVKRILPKKRAQAAGVTV